MENNKSKRKRRAETFLNLIGFADLIYLPILFQR